MKLVFGKFLSLLSWDFKLQLRYYFWTVGLVVTGVWLLLLSSLTEEASDQWIPVLIFADIGQIGLLFIAGILYLERRQGTIAVAAIMPISTGVWLAAKLVSLSLLCTFCAITIVLFNSGSVNWFRLIPASVLSAALFTSFGFLLACPFDKIMNYFLVMALAMAVMNIPVLGYLGIVDSTLMWILPSQASIWVLAGSFQEMPASSFYSALLILLAWIALLHWLGIRSFRLAISSG